MAVRAETLKNKQIGRIVDLARAKLSRGKAKSAEFFIRAFFVNVPPDDLLGEETENLLGGALALMRFGERRRANQAKIRVYNPDIEKDGWQSPHTVIEIVNDDMPFLVDSVTMALNRLELTVHLVVHPTFIVKRNRSGDVGGYTAGVGGKGTRRESYMQVLISEQTSKSALSEIERRLKRVLVDVRAAVEDWRAMLDEVKNVGTALEETTKSVDESDVAEAVAFLNWAHDDHFTFLGCREYKLVGRGAASHLEILPKSGKGILRDDEVLLFEGLRDAGRLTPEVEAFIRQPMPLLVTKGNLRSTIHRPVHVDVIGVKRFDKKGKVTGEYLFVGLFTSNAYSLSPRQIPFLRRKVDAAMELSGFDPASHNGKALRHVLDNYPRDELFQIEPVELHDISRGIIQLQERQHTALFVRRDPFDRFVSAFVYTPRERYTQAIRQAFGEILSEAFNGRIAAYYTQFSDEVLGRLQYIISAEDGIPTNYDLREIEARLQEATRTWGEKLLDALIDIHGEERGNYLQRSLGDGFPVAYREQLSVQDAVFDVERLDEVARTKGFALNSYHPAEVEDNEFRLKIYNFGEPVFLSDALPVLENMGLIVVGEYPYAIRVHDGAANIHIHDYELRIRAGTAIDFLATREAFKESFTRVWRSEMEDDGFNQLVLVAGLNWREVVIMRAYAKYLRQARIPFSQDYMEETLAGNPKIVRAIIELFLTRFDPAGASAGTGREARQLRRINAMLDKVANLDEDRILRHFVNLVQATLRTNYYQVDDDGTPRAYLSFKFASREIEELPLPRPLREIFVYSPRFEAVHLRFGFVARGGLRWSDRREDFRTEVLGLVKAQQVKNSVIVPVGSKGGFVLKKAPPPADREAFMEEGISCYRLFIGAMLEITDNLDGDTVIPPPMVLRKDDDDPYLVVAADKGTATFSDFANGVAREKGFWLDDAFASGGSAGYDHKGMGITARGAWESVKRHFREMGHDTQSEDFTVVGCGDMSGDVFGNGMLLSEHIKLVGGFNHLHIFVDPDPDPKRSFKERKRLFDLPRSGWADYDTALISKGGGIFDRSAKSIALTAEIKKLFDIEQDNVTPNELIRAMLLGQIDLLWFGGIGTYIKASSESDLDAGDRANDPLRVNGDELRCKVIGEGANLGATQLGRVEYAMAGGCANTDFIDNSAGVDCSDHEVNIKIVLGDVVQRGDMTMRRRDALLARMTDEVGELVLRDNYQQTQAITTAEARSYRLLDRQNRFMRSLERAGQLDRDIEFLPDEEEVADRLAANEGLTRPEISVLFSYAKIVAYEELLASDLPDEPLLVEDLVGYFPKPLRVKFRESIERHRLSREIIATLVTNSLIDRVGATFTQEMEDATGQPTAEIARAYLISRDAFDLRDLWARIEALDNKVDAALQTSMMQDTNRLGQRNVQWFLRNGKHPLDITRTMGEFADSIRRLRENISAIVGPEDQAAMERHAARLAREGVPGDLAEEISKLEVLASACDIVRIAATTKRRVENVGAIYFGVGSRLSIDWLKSTALAIVPENDWQKRALDAVVDDLYAHQSALTHKVLAGPGKARSTDRLIENWIDSRGAASARVREVVSDLRIASSLDIPMLAVANRELRNLVGE